MEEVGVSIQIRWIEWASLSKNSKGGGGAGVSQMDNGEEHSRQREERVCVAYCLIAEQ